MGEKRKCPYLGTDVATKRRVMLWIKLIPAQSMLENAAQLKLDNESQHDNKSLNDNENC
jgi:hypothetical protein